MFRTVHPNRWFFWAVACLIIVGLSLILYIQVTGEEFERQTQDATFGPAAWHTFRSRELGLSVRYPPGWQIEIDRFDARTFYLENPGNYDENISFAVTDPTLEKVIRQSLDYESEKDIVIDGMAGVWLGSKVPKDQATRNVVLVIRNRQLYYFAGQAKHFERIVESVRFIHPLVNE